MAHYRDSYESHCKIDDNTEVAYMDWVHYRATEEMHFDTERNYSMSWWTYKLGVSLIYSQEMDRTFSLTLVWHDEDITIDDVPADTEFEMENVPWILV